MIARDVSGHGGFCLIPRPVSLGPCRVYDSGSARAGSAGNLLFWARHHRDAARASDTMTGYRYHRRLMRWASRMWRLVK